MKWLAVFTIAFAPMLADAQATPKGGGCPPGSGIRITANAGNGSSTAAAPTVITAMDTVLVFDFAERKWARTDFAAMVDVGWASEDRRRFNVCAGVSIEMPEATLVVRGARGRIHFRASLDRLTTITSRSM